MSGVILESVTMTLCFLKRCLFFSTCFRCIHVEQLTVYVSMLDAILSCVRKGFEPWWGGPLRTKKKQVFYISYVCSNVSEELYKLSWVKCCQVLIIYLSCTIHNKKHDTHSKKCQGLWIKGDVWWDFGTPYRGWTQGCFTLEFGIWWVGCIWYHIMREEKHKKTQKIVFEFCFWKMFVEVLLHLYWREMCESSMIAWILKILKYDGNIKKEIVLMSNIHNCVLKK